MAHLFKIRFVAALFILALMSACSGGDSGGSNKADDGATLTAVDITGIWSLQETISNYRCQGGTNVVERSIAITQDGSDYTITILDDSGNPTKESYSSVLTASTFSWARTFQSSDYLADAVTRITLEKFNFILKDGTISGKTTWSGSIPLTPDGDMAGAKCTGTAEFTGQRSSKSVPGSKTAPAAPTALIARSNSSTSVRLDWTDNANDETAYEIWLSKDNFRAENRLVDTLDTNSNTTVVRNLQASTTYYFRVRAVNLAGKSDYSTVASITLPPTPGSQAPRAPTNLRKDPLAVSSSTGAISVKLLWDDNSDNETGFRLYRATDYDAATGNGSFRMVAELAANSAAHVDSNGLLGSTQYHYYVTAYRGENESSSNILAVTTAPTEYVLNISLSGNGNGSVSDPDNLIACPTGCNSYITENTTIKLVATANSNSAFSNWENCDNANGNICEFNMTSDKYVVAVFNKTYSNLSFILPATSSSGNYSISWRYQSLFGGQRQRWIIEEDRTPAFNNPTSYTVTSFGNGINSYTDVSYDFTGKTNGVYCYRIRRSESTLFSRESCITVNIDNSATIIINNNSHYPIISLRINNQELLAYPYAIHPGNSDEVLLASGGQVSITAKTGFYDGTQAVEWFSYNNDYFIQNGSTFTYDLNNPTLGDMLTGLSSTGQRSWLGSYYCSSCNQLLNFAEFRFSIAGDTATWNFYDNGTLIGSGTAILVSWPDYANAFSFKLCPDCDIIYVNYPFGSFKYENGPSDWPVIEYIMQ